MPKIHFALLCVAVSFGAIAQEPPRAPQFSRFVSREHGFSVMMPGQPAITRKVQTATKTGRPIHLTSYLADLGSRAYMVMIADYDEQSTIDLDGAANGILSSLQHPEVLARSKTTFFGRPGRTLDVAAAPNLRLRYRLFAVGRRLYQVALVAPRDRFEDAEPDFYLNSFNLSQ